jgi:metallo-beta-lactamase family protein
MELSFHGAAGTTTGSCHLLRFGGSSILLDCGLYQGRRDESYRLNSTFDFDPREVTAVVQSHAHIDHSGKLPMLVKHGFAGRIHATRATADLCSPLLYDCAHIMLADAEHLNRQKKVGNDRDEIRAGPDPGDLEPKPAAVVAKADDRFQPGLPSPLDPHRRSAPPPPEPGEAEAVPLYLEQDVRETLPRFSNHEYGEWFEAAPRLRFRFRDAGHILGSAWIEAEIGSGPSTRRLVFTGDYGRDHQPILRDPEPLSEADVYISESTYGNRLHPAHQDLDVELAAAVRRLAQRGKGRLLIPAFAVGRTQNILYALARFYRDGTCPGIRIVVDSPLATLATQVVARHPECFDEEALRDFESLQKDPCFRPHLTFTESKEESIALNDDPRPTIVISASGMMESGRILHHLAHWISSPDAEILVVGFQAANTLGRRVLEGAKEVRVLGVEHTVRARVTPMLGLSAHADRDGLLAALGPHAGRAQALFLVHGEDDQRKPLAAELVRRGYARVETPSDARNYRFE